MQICAHFGPHPQLGRILDDMKASKSPSPSLEVMTVGDPAAAAALTDPHTLRQLEPFLARAATIAEAARETGAKPNTVLLRVRRFLRLGLLTVVAEEPRAGRRVKRYRTAADGFFIPFDATSAESLEAALAERDAYWEALLRQGVVRARSEAAESWGTRVYRDARGRLQVQTAVTPERNFTTLDPEGPAALSAWRDRVYLDYDDAKALQRELFDLLLRYQRKQGSQRYIVRLGLAPLREDA